MTNREFSQKDTKFIEACTKVGLPFSKPSHKSKKTLSSVSNTLTRQASKWRMQKGLAYKKGR